MKFNIYDYNNGPTEIDTGNKEIKELEVLVLTGDEIVTIRYEDGSKERYDSSYTRGINYFDDEYTVTKENIQKWIQSAMSTNEIISYNRSY